MLNYQVTIVPHSSLFMARGRGNRAIRHSFPYIPASTVGGALNTRLYQIGWTELMRTFRFSNLYPTCKKDIVWLPTPRTLYHCPLCDQVVWMQDFDPISMVNEVMCPVCGAMRRPLKGFAASCLTHDTVQPIACDSTRLGHPIRKRLPALSAQLSGRVALHRTTGGHIDGQLHFVELLRARNLPFRGVAWLKPEIDKVLQPHTSFRLMVGGLRSRGSGHVTLFLKKIEAADTLVRVDDQLLVETPLLPLPKALSEKPPAFIVQAISPYVRVEVCERWAAKPVRWGKGLVSFLNVLAVGSVLRVNSVNSNTALLQPGLFFYSMIEQGLALHYVESPFPDEPVMGQDYTVADLWTLGFGQLRRIDIDAAT